MKAVLSMYPRCLSAASEVRRHFAALPLAA